MTTKRNPKATDGKVSIEYSTTQTEIGDLMLVTDGSALVGLYFSGCGHIPAASKRWARNERHPVLQMTAKQLKEYFAGKRTEFSIPLRLTGTEFQEKIWREIARIPHGQTITYSELAEQSGVSQAIRAVGTATGRNPVSIIVPCHRVMGKNDTLCGFAGGLDRKRHLLALENDGARQAKLKLK